MIDENGEYELYVGYYSFYESGLDYVLDASVTPDVRELTITGKNEPAEPGYLDYNTTIFLTSSLTLSSDVVIKNLRIETSGADNRVINLKGHTITFDGNSTYIVPRICGTENGSTIISKAVKHVYLYGGAEVYKVSVENVGIAYGEDTYVKFCNTNGYYILKGGIKVEFEYIT